jgi:hypothetical protein
MQAYRRETINTGKGALPMFVWQGSYSAWLEHARAMHADSRRYRGLLAERCDEGWAGMPGQDVAALLSTGIIDAALRDFEAAQAKLLNDNLLPGSMQPAVAGGAWIVPLVLANNPMPARIRTRSKLPPRSLDLCTNVSSHINPADVTASMARIAKAAWLYILAGGAVTITAHYIHKFSKPCDGQWGVLHSIKVPITNCAALASACSVQHYRGMDIIAAQCLSGDPHDGLPLVKWKRPGLLHVTGRLEDDAKARAALRIEDAPHAP